MDFWDREMFERLSEDLRELNRSVTRLTDLQEAAAPLRVVERAEEIRADRTKAEVEHLNARWASVARLYGS
jgi:hypothetical protein